MNTGRLPDFVDAFGELMARTDDGAQILATGAALLQRLVAHDDWLPTTFGASSPESYRQYLLFTDPQNRFVMVSFVWQPGQSTPIHDHTVWGLIGQLRWYRKQ